MRIPLLATLSGRIVLGFAVLILTFGTISAVIVFNMGLLSREIRVIRTSYLPLALETKNLDEKQDILWSYINSELSLEVESGRATTELYQKLQVRSTALRAVEKVLNDATPVPPGHREQFERTRRQIAQLGQDIEQLTAPYKLLMQTPPLERLRGSAELSPDKHGAYEESERELKRVITAESDIRSKIRLLARQQSDQAKQIGRSLEKNERRLRIFSIYLGLTALLVGLLITIWATVTLRPLRRLRDAAQRIALGDYQSRIAETGPTEVADLARDFNVMGSAIEERERQRVRHERLAAVGKMAALIVHEVRNPLSAIGLNTELLEEELAAMPDSDEARELCRAITTEVDRLTAITEQYLEVARLPKPKLQAEQLNGIVRDLAEFQREQMALRGVELSLELAEDLPLVRVDQTQLRQALLNLLRNATDATVEVGGGRVLVTSSVFESERGPVVEVCVRDRGPGIAHELMDKLFEPFSSTKDSGTGLGLALTHQIVREHGGDIRVDSRPGQGAAFIVSLPVA